MAVRTKENKKTCPDPNGSDRDGYETVIPLCFVPSSRKTPQKVLTHPLDVTVEPGTAYTATLSANSLRKEFTIVYIAVLHHPTAL